jgi:hypothetical protein
VGPGLLRRNVGRYISNSSTVGRTTPSVAVKEQATGNEPVKRHGKKTKTFLIRLIKKYFTPRKVQIIGKWDFGIHDGKEKGSQQNFCQFYCLLRISAFPKTITIQLKEYKQR